MSSTSQKRKLSLHVNATSQVICSVRRGIIRPTVQHTLVQTTTSRFTNEMSTGMRINILLVVLVLKILQEAGEINVGLKRYSIPTRVVLTAIAWYITIAFYYHITILLY